MKKAVIFGLLAMAMFTGCGSLAEHSQLVFYRGYDFRPYTEEGFTVTPYRYDGPHTILGMYRIEVYPEVRRTSSWETPDSSKYYLKSYGGSRYLIGILNGNDALKEAVKVSKNLGADILMDFDIKLEPLYEDNWRYEVTAVIAKKK